MPGDTVVTVLMMSSSSGGYVDPSFPNPNGPDDAPIIIYGYLPSLVLGILGLILFVVAAILHLYQVLRFRTWYFIPVEAACVMETVGYIFRILSSKVDPYNITFFVVQVSSVDLSPFPLPWSYGLF